MADLVLDNQRYGRFHRKLFFLSSGGPFLDGYILSIIGSAIAGASSQLRLSPTEEGLVAAVSLVGVLLGGLVFGWVTDRVGRQTMYTIDLAVLVLSSALCLFIDAGWQLVLLRLLAGLAVGADYPIASSMLAEWLPAARRGRTMGALCAAWSVGASVAFGVAYLFAVGAGDGAWRWMLASAAVPALLVLVARIGTPESPRWLMRNGRADQAREAIRRAFGEYPTDEQLRALAAAEPPKKSRLRDVFAQGYQRRTLFVGLFWFCQVAPSFAIGSFYPVVLGSLGFSTGSTALLWSMAVSAAAVVGCVPTLLRVDRWGRRPVLLGTFVLVLIPLTALGIVPGMPVALAITMLGINALAQGGGSILQWIYPTELFPTDIRASAVGVANAVSRVGAAAGTYLMPVGIAGLGLGPTMLVGAAVTLVGLLVCFAWAPETKGRALHETAAINAPAEAPSTDSVVK